VISSLSHFATGGPISSNLASIVGENGPEIFMPSTAGRIVPNSKLGGSVEQHFHFNINGSDPAATRAMINRTIAQHGPTFQRMAEQGIRDTNKRYPSSKRV
jgi:hypothetical protein